MQTVTLGKTGITVDKNGFGALPIQRVAMEEAKTILRRAFDGGIRFFDTARVYSDSEEKLGAALSDVRSQIYISTKSQALTAEGFNQDLETSLRNLRTDYVDIIQFHNPPFCPRPGGEDGLYEAALAAQRAGKVRFIGITNHRLAVAQEAVDSGLYATLQFPFSYLASEKDIALAQSAADADMGFLAMKALSGGLITNSAAAYAWMTQYPHVLPIWGVQRMSELEEFLSYIDTPPALTEELQAVIARDRAELAGNFCRGCGYCLPCPQEIDIPTCARMKLLLGRSPVAGYVTPEAQAEMAKIDSCLHCGQCAGRCPYGLDTPKLLEENLAFYRAFIADRQGK